LLNKGYRLYLHTWYFERTL